MTPGWQPEWSKWAAIIVLAEVASLVAYEVWALHEPGDSWPTITSLVIAAIREHWWVGVVVLGTLGWLIVHFAKRWIAL